MTISLDSTSPLMQKDFCFGVATAAFQIEGSSTADGRCDSIWDSFCAEQGNVLGGDDGSIACDHYNLWQQDIKMIKSLGVDAYRLSIAWPRIINSKDGNINSKGLAFYEAIIDELNRNNIKVFVTLYHWDLPQYLEDQGGWLNRDTAYAFVKYTAVISQHFGDKIYSYATFNEPWCSAFLGYQYGIHAPGHASRKKGLQAAHHILLAHGLTVPVIRKHTQSAEIGIVLNFTPGYSTSNQEKDIKATEIYNEYNSHWFIQPLLQGSYPTLIEENYKSDLPHIETGDLALIATKIDFLGINFYTRSVVADPAHSKEQAITEGPTQDSHFQLITQKNVEHTDIGWEVYPKALTDLLLSFNQRYELPPVYITENGAAFDDQIIDGEVHDLKRCKYLQQHLQAVEIAVNSGVNIKGYFAWSLMDNFEWAEGYSKRFGLVYVDYPSQTRTLKQSAKEYAALLKSRDFVKS